MLNRYLSISRSLSIWALGLAALLLAPFSGAGAVAGGEEARMIHVDVTGSGAGVFRPALEEYLTREKGFALVEDLKPGAFRVHVEETRQANGRKTEVTFRIDNLEIWSPEGGKVLSISGREASDDGWDARAAATRAARSLVGLLAQDPSISGHLSRVAQKRFRALELTGLPEKGKKIALVKKISALAAVDLNLRPTMLDRDKEKALEERIINRVMEKAPRMMDRLLASQKPTALVSQDQVEELAGLIRCEGNRGLDYTPQAPCPPKKYSRVGAVLIRADVDQGMAGKCLDVRAPDCRVVYRQTERHRGAPVMRSRRSASRTWMKDFLKDEKSHLVFEAVDQGPGYVTVSFEDADALVAATRQGVSVPALPKGAAPPAKLFYKSMVAVIPQ